MKFYSILFKKENKQNIPDKDLDIFKDLNLKDIFDAIVSEKKSMI